jgi:hypothetical protein
MRNPPRQTKTPYAKHQKSGANAKHPVFEHENPGDYSNYHSAERVSSFAQGVKDINILIEQRNIFLRRTAFMFFSLLLFGFAAYEIKSIFIPTPIVVTTPNASLTSISYSYAGWKPRMIDLRTASTLGIAAREKDLLQFFDVWVSSNANVNNLGYQVKAKLYAGEELIGETEPQVMQPGVFQLGGIKLIQYADGNHPNSLVVQKGWDALSLKVVCLENTKEVSETVSTIRFSTTDRSYLVAPPQAYVLSIAFSINDEDPRLLDLTEAPTKGIGVSAGTTFEIRSIKVRTNMVAPEKWMRAEAYISEGTWESEIISKSISFSESVINIPFDEPMRWQITDKDKFLVLTLYREDGAVLDTYDIPLKATSETSLIGYSSAVVWPFEKVTYLDFEKYTEVEEWHSEDDQPITLDSTTEHAFSGHRSLSVKLNGPLAKSDTRDYIVRRDISFQSNLIIGQVYWPSRDGVHINYAALCIGGIGHCFDLPKSALIPDRWNTFFIDLSAAKDKNDQPFSSQEFKSFYFQANVEGVPTNTPYKFFLDGFQIFPVAKDK